MTRLDLSAMTAGLTPVASDTNTEWSVVNLSSSFTYLIHAAKFTKSYASDVFFTCQEIADAIQKVDAGHDAWVLAGFRDMGVDPRSSVENRIWNDADEYHVLAAVHIYIDGWRHTVDVFNITTTDPQWVFEEEQDDDIR